MAFIVKLKGRVPKGKGKNTGLISFVECKHWKTRVSKLHVLALREIVSDVGADRGILLSEEGFQSGAIEAAMLTNVRLTSLAELRVSAANDIYEARFYDLLNRIHDCHARYWAIPKRQRIDHDLRPEVGEGGYSGAQVVDLVNGLLSLAFRRRYPFKFDALISFALPNIPKELGSPKEVFEILDPIVNELEQRLSVTEAKLSQVLKNRKCEAVLNMPLLTELGNHFSDITTNMPALRALRFAL
jgi:restriction system protein